MKDLNELASQIAEMAGQQGERRSAAQSALAALVEKSNAISKLITDANQGMTDIGGQMQSVVKRTQQMKKMTGDQAKRSAKLMEITDESSLAATQTMEGAGVVVGTTEKLRSLSNELTKQVAQFKIEEDMGFQQSSQQVDA